jgi:hypothetical protein
MSRSEFLSLTGCKCLLSSQEVVDLLQRHSTCCENALSNPPLSTPNLKRHLLHLVRYNISIPDQELIYIQET